MTAPSKINCATGDELQDLKEKYRLLQQEVERLKETEKQLRKSEERSKLVEKMTHLGYVEYTIEEEEYSYCSEEFYKILDMNSSDDRVLKLDAVASVIHPDDRERVFNHMSEYISTSVKHRLLLADGTIKHVVTTRCRYIDDFKTFIGTLQDVTESTIAEQRAESLASIVESSLHEISIWDRNSFKFIEMNKSGLKNLGYTSEEMQHLTLLDLLPDFSDEGFEDLLRPLINGTKERVSFSSQLIRKNGVTYDMDTVFQLCQFGDKDAVFAITNDTTERNHMQKCLRQSDKMNALGQLVGGGSLMILIIFLPA